MELKHSGCARSSRRLAQAATATTFWKSFAQESYAPCLLAPTWLLSFHELVQAKVRPNKRMKLSWRGGRSKGKESFSMAIAAPRSLCAIRWVHETVTYEWGFCPRGTRLGNTPFGRQTAYPRGCLFSRSERMVGHSETDPLPDVTAVARPNATR